MSTRYLSQLAHLEITSPKPQETLDFFARIMGLEESGREGQSVFMRGWGEFFHHSLQITEGPAPALVRVGWRAQGAEELQDAVKRIEATGQGIGWTDGTPGYGAAYQYRAPGGHLHEIFWEVERAQVPDALKATYPNRAQRYVPRGLAARSLDHVTIASANVVDNVEWYRRTLGHRYMEYTVTDFDPNLVVFAMTTVCERSHDLGIVADFSGMSGRINHFAYWVDQREDLRRAADVLLDADIPIEFGPGRHGMGEQDYLYCREPGGLRVELNSGGYKNYEPDWEPVRWTPAQGSNVYYRNIEMPHSMFESFPPEQQTRDEHRQKMGLFV